MATNQAWLIFALLSAMCAGLTAVFAKIGLEGVDSDYALLLRTILIACILIPLVAATGKWVDPLTLPRRALIFICLSAIATGASWLFYFRALQLGSVAQVAPVDKLSIVFAAVLAAAFLGERPDVRGWFGIALVVLGVLVLGLRR